MFVNALLWTSGLLACLLLGICPQAIPALGRWIKVNVSDKWHRPIAMRTLYIGRTLLCFGRFHLSQCSALPARRIPKKVSGTGQMPWTLNSVPVGFPMKLKSARALMLELFKGHRV
jgi:hypothetical protein